MTNSPRSCAGVTLVELMVVLVLMGLMASVVGLAWRREPSPNPADQFTETIAAARHQALASGRAVRVQVTIAGHNVMVAALPDGRVIAPEELHLDALTGLPAHE